MSNDTMVAVQRDVKAWLQKPEVVASITAALPRHMDGEKFAKIALTAINRNPKLLECTRESLMLAMLQSAALGLEPNGRDAHLIPYGNQCQFQLDYKGIVQLVRRSGEIADIHCDVVRRGDLFTYKFGKVVDHVPWFLRDDAKKPAAPGEIYAVYSRVEMKDAGVACDVMSVEEINQIRDGRSQGYKAAKKYNKVHPWDYEEQGGSYCEMAKKTVFKRHSKWLPISSELAEALTKEDEADDSLVIDSAEIGKSIDEAASRPKPPPRAKGVAAMKNVTPEAPKPEAPKPEAPKPEAAPAATEPAPAQAPAPVQEDTKKEDPKKETGRAEGPAEQKEWATHELTAFRDIKAKKPDGTETTITACELKNVDDGKALTAYWDHGRDKLPDLGWVAVKIELRPHSTKPGVTVPFLAEIVPASAPEI